VTAILSLREACAEHVRDGDVVAMEGFTHLIPFAAGHELLRQGRKDLTLLRMTPDVLYDQLVGAGAVRKLEFSWGGNPGVGSLHRFRDAVENGWPRPIELVEHTHATMAVAYAAGASRLPFGLLRHAPGTDTPAHNPHIKTIDCPFSGEILMAVEAHRPDVTVIHAQRSDRAGNVQFWGFTSVQKEAALAARRVIVTVEECVDRLTPVPGAVVLPAVVVSAVCVVAGGAWPSYAQGYSERDNAFYLEWDTLSRERDRFTAWIDRHVRATADLREFKESLRRA
jgi:glutaconate CoA-transferase subunit A